MRTHEPVRNVHAVSMRPQPASDRPARVLIAGGGAAGLEALIALRTLAGSRVELELISPERTFRWRSMAVAAAFGDAPAPRVDLAEMASTVDATYACDSVVAVDAADRNVTLADGATREYDVLVACIGAQTEDAIPGAIAFGAPRGITRFRQMLELAERGDIATIVFAVPLQTGWPLALYELALLTAERLRHAAKPVDVTLITPEAAPLAAFGGRASGAVLEELEDHGIHFVPGLTPEEIAWGELRAGPGAVRIQADAVITLPRLIGPSVPGIPVDEDGFIPVDAHGLVRGTADLYAAGDAIACGVKHGGLATQQADAAAEAIAARVGAPVTPAPFAPVLRGVLLTGEGPRSLESTLTGSASSASSAASGAASARPLWWPPAKIAGRYLGPYLTGSVASPPTPCSSVVVDVDFGAQAPSALAAGAGRR
jgi:sulfide:quinone oxidoreductase